jgi:putative pyruvate formate lyase activating enzyme
VKVTRRGFIRGSLSLGGALLLFPSSLHAVPQEKKDGWVPAYERLEKEGRFAEKVQRAYSIFENCRLCPRRCGANRLKGGMGFCGAPPKPVIFSAHPHFGEEIPLVGRHGSGTIFFSNCNLRCVFCQNWPISH